MDSTIKGVLSDILFECATVCASENANDGKETVFFFLTDAVDQVVVRRQSWLSDHLLLHIIGAVE